jgi:hypothetical protein
MPEKNKREAPFSQEGTLLSYTWQLKSTTLSSRSEDWCQFFENGQQRG